VSEDQEAKQARIVEGLHADQARTEEDQKSKAATPFFKNENYIRAMIVVASIGGTWMFSIGDLHRIDAVLEDRMNSMTQRITNDEVAIAKMQDLTAQIVANAQRLTSLEHELNSLDDHGSRVTITLDSEIRALKTIVEDIRHQVVDFNAQLLRHDAEDRVLWQALAKKYPGTVPRIGPR